MLDLLASVQVTASVPPVLRWLGGVLATAWTAVAAQGGAVLGAAAGSHPVVTAPAALGVGVVVALVVRRSPPGC